MKELNELTRRLLAEGYTPEDTPPGTCEYKSYYGGWTYTSQALNQMVFETPCGLLVRGSRFTNGYLASRGVDWRPENDNPVIPCPRFASGPCSLRHPFLQMEKLCCGPDDVVYQCDCHPTDRPYTYEGSLDEAHKQVWQESDELWKAVETAHNGRVCRYQSRYGRTSKTWTTYYSPMECARLWPSCSHCSVLEKDLTPQKGNVFYDVKRTWTEKGTGLFPDEERVSIEKGCKLLEKTVSMTICEAIIQYGRRDAEQRVLDRYQRAMFFDPTLKIEVLNLRAARMDTRDILLDLQDVANGIQVTHAADSLKAAKAQKKARREAAKKQRIRNVEQMLLTCGRNGLDDLWRRRAEKLLDDQRIDELHLQWKAAQAQTPPEETQIRLF